jgi:succinate dehydrogenase/fumarate reductase cytochrome b subunit
MTGGMGEMMGSGLFWVLFALLFWVLLVASLFGIRIFFWVFDAAQRR